MKQQKTKTLSEIFWEFLFVFDDVREPVLRSEVDVKVRKAFRNRSTKRFVTKGYQLLVIRPLTFAFLKIQNQCFITEILL